jgi:predicted FMN-binding regulatory protein PaiB
MYLRKVHAEAQIAVLQQLIRENPLGILTTAIKSSLYPLIQSSHIPFILDVPETPDGATSNGILRGHLAKQNPQAKALMEALTAVQNEHGHHIRELSEEVLILFNGPYHHYITPKFYIETKPETGKVVPTWDYSAAQAYGKIRVYCDSKSEETGSFLQQQLEDLSRHAETSIMGHTGGLGLSAWAVSDAPVSYIEIMKKNIIGIEIEIERLEGKFKMSQELGEGDRDGVIQGFENLGTEVGLGVARTVRERNS